jgi:mRNA interferase MazF
MEDEIYIKNFKDWFLTKEKLESNSYIPVIEQGDIWHLRVGVNLGSEIDGKGDGFIRPVYVFKRINKYSFIGIPLTTKQLDCLDRIKITGTNSYLAFSQIKSYSIKRCVKLKDSLSDEEQRQINSEFYKIFCI